MDPHSKKRSAIVAAALVAGAVAAAQPAAAQQNDPQPGGQQPSGQQPSGQQPSDQQVQQGAGQQPAAEPAKQQNTAAFAAEAITTPVTVKKIDKKEGVITLRDQQGNTFDVKAGPAVDLDHLHVGDKVTASYYREVALGIDPAPKGPPTAIERTIQHGGVTARQATVTAHIIAVDPKANLVSMRAPDGSIHLLRVEDPSLQARLKQIKPGQAFDVTYTQAVALTIEPRKR